MNTRSRIYLLNSSGSSRWFTIHALALCVLMLCASAFAQQSDVVASAIQTQIINDACSASEPCVQGQPPLPNAPSTIHPVAFPTDSLTFGQRATIYRQAILRPYTIVGPALGAGVGQWENEPPEWGQGGEGYARRLASGMARNLISETIRFGFAAADGEDPRYHPSQESGVWNRARHAIVEIFTSETSSLNNS